MIKSKKDYLHYTNEDMRAHGFDLTNTRNKLKVLVGIHETIKFQILLRKVEYFENVSIYWSWLQKISLIYYKYKFNKISIKLGFSIPTNVFGPGLAIVHYGTIIVNPRAKVGANCRLHACTNIGESGGQFGAPLIGDNVYIAPGVKIYGKIKIVDNVGFAANAAVYTDCLEEYSMYGGVPAKRIKSIDIKKIIKHIK